jgi:cyclopropane fatty-acyl-phospholipid synthase-like methyltransferase
MSFDLLAPHYRWMEWLLAGEKLQRCRTAHVAQLVDASKILVLGEGNGRFLVECRKAAPDAEITCVDSSRLMLRAAERRLAAHGLTADRVHFLQANALTFYPPAQTYDAIVTHFFLDCFQPEQLRGLVGILATACQQRAKWFLADFQLPKQGWRRTRAVFIHLMMYAFFRAVTRLPARRLTAPDPMLQSHGFRLAHRVVSEWELLRSDLWELGSCLTGPACPGAPQ